MRRVNLSPISKGHVVRESAAHSPVPDLGHTYVTSPKTGQTYKATASQVAQAQAVAANARRGGRARQHVRGR